MSGLSILNSAAVAWAKMRDQRNEKVRAVLLKADGPMTPTEIAAAISEEWCCYGGKPSGACSAPISPVLKRIGAVGTKGKWALPKESA